MTAGPVAPLRSDADRARSAAGAGGSAGWRFGDCELRVDARELHRDGQPVDLEPRAFDLLVFLIEHRDRVVGHEEMLAAVWPGMVLSDSAFTQAIRKVRRAVGDDGQAQHSIRTISRRGYRFIAEVRSLSPQRSLASPIAPAAAPASAAAPATAPATAPGPGRRLRWLLAGAVLLALTLGLGISQLATRQAPRYAVLPVQVAGPQADLGWVELGLMALIADALRDEGIDTLAPSAVLATLEHGDTGQPDPASQARLLLQHHGPVRVVATTLSAEPGGWRLDLGTYDAGGRSTASQVRASSPAALAGIVATHLAVRDDAGPAADTGLADELYARGLSASLDGDHAAAADYFGVALREQPGRPWLRYELALAQRQLGRVDAAQATLAELAAPGGHGDDPRLAIASLSALGILEWRRGQLDRAQDVLQQAWDLAQAPRHASDRASLAMSLGIVASSRGDWDRAQDLYLRALSGFREIGARQGEARAYNSLGVLAWNRGRYPESMRMHRAALAIRQGLGARGDLAASLNNLGTGAMVQGDWQEAERLYQEALTLRQTLEDGSGVARSSANLADLQMWRGRLREADLLAATSLALARQHSYRPVETQACHLLVDIALRRGDVAQANARLDDCPLPADAQQSTQLERQMQQYRLALLLGDATDPDALLSAADRHGAPAMQIEARLIAAAHGDQQARAARLGRALELARSHGHPGLIARTATALGQLWLDQQRVDDSEALLPESALWPDHAPAALLAGRHAAARKDFALAVRELQRAKTLAGETWTADSETLLASTRARAAGG